MEWLATWLASFLVSNYEELKKIAYKAFGLFISLGGFISALLVLIVGLVDVDAVLSTMTTAVNNATGIIQAAPVMPVMDKLNRVFPVNEALLFLSVWMAAKVISMVIRFGIRIATLFLG